MSFRVQFDAYQFIWCHSYMKDHIPVWLEWPVKLRQCTLSGRYCHECTFNLIQTRLQVAAPFHEGLSKVWMESHLIVMKDF